jgi:hypothetical protein
MQYLSVRNIERFQHYTKRNPPWVKLHKEFITNYELRCLPVHSRLFFACCWLLASEMGNKIPLDYKYLSDRVGFPVSKKIILPLVNTNALSLCSVLSSDNSPLPLTENSNMLATCLHDASKMLAVANEEFEQFWQAFPRKIGKKAALQSWVKAKDKPPVADIIQSIEKAKKSVQWTKENGQFIPHPSTWLNQGRWADQMAVSKPSVFEDFLSRGGEHDAI